MIGFTNQTDPLSVIGKGRFIYELCEHYAGEGLIKEYLKEVLRIFAKSFNDKAEKYLSSLLPPNRRHSLYLSEAFISSVEDAKPRGDYLGYLIDVLSHLQIDENRKLLDKKYHLHKLEGFHDKIYTIWAYSDSKRRILLCFAKDLHKEGNGVYLLDYTTEHPDYDGYRDVVLENVSWKEYKPSEIGLAVDPIVIESGGTSNFAIKTNRGGKKKSH